MDPELIALVCWYYFETERFDRALPGAWDPHVPDVWQPFQPHRRASYAHARDCHSRLLKAAREAGFAPEQLQWTKDYVTRWSFDRWGAIAQEPTKHLAELRER